ncbi:enoyl-CoA hydratase-related protein [Geoalkalibacter halelectricus]|uniref:Enoyl-CoA hydratase-related protein n=1 Tax=Geoalkalibacter halelectricus TaxID=2847045 RepID=A0ABY5ZNB1_9BACT|nr:enoyl-CoA hydratase-related protein [Geoalkalibacter halelectricus]MDO3380295.1 enoyl-CoA hydratase-related protein [Geoalkalibacter halelectricus]UWZ79447.1 enoyl-CoA hydratase-related protein [Geoalkalibacter halelectricus]
MEFRSLLFEASEGVATLTVNRPKALNALNEATLKELQCCFAGIQDNQEIKVVILTGAGEKAFVAGADIAAMQAFDALAAREFARLGHAVFNLIENLPQPVIAAVNGFALGGGCELAMACDIRLAGENARFGQPEVNLGVIPGFGGTLRLARLVGKGRAKELILTGEMIDAREAHRIGLVNQVLPPGELLESAVKMAKKIASKGQVAVRLGKEAIDNGLEMDQDRAARYEAELFGLCFASADQKEGMAAFLEKRAAHFRGR